jgi:UDP-N-acetylmuramyl pentapeptide phosphotransferase/UDP-N-acetylglucosamine-1-phosphate transferase
MDGINGITGGYSVVLVLALWYINYDVISFTDGHLLLVLLIALMVFNFYNFRKKARCFAGDTGAVSIAFILLFLDGQLIIRSQDSGFIILFGVYGIDSIFTIIHRLILKENIFKPHRKHVYQLMANELKMPHVLVSSIYMILQIALIGGYIWFRQYLPEYRFHYFFISLGLLALIYFLFKKKYYRLHMMT